MALINAIVDPISYDAIFGIEDRRHRRTDGKPPTFLSLKSHSRRESREIELGLRRLKSGPDRVDIWLYSRRPLTRIQNDNNTRDLEIRQT